MDGGYGSTGSRQFINPKDFPTSVEKDATAYFQSKYPQEGCGLVVGGEFVPVENIHPEPTRNFLMPEDTWAKYVVQGVLHSHTHGVLGPSKEDMQSQIDCAVPFGIIMCNGQTACTTVWFGDHVLLEPLVKRPFIFGVFDCFSLGRSWYWQEKGIYVPNFARDADFWRRKEDLFGGHMLESGFKEVGMQDFQVGDVLLMGLWAKVPNHCAIILGRNLILHHKDGCPSNMEPMLQGWLVVTKKVLRYAP